MVWGAVANETEDLIAFQLPRLRYWKEEHWVAGNMQTASHKRENVAGYRLISLHDANPDPG
jgi:hypothetical protein